jgi:membrane fusion protein, copper/silver efflux system
MVAIKNIFEKIRQGKSGKDSRFMKYIKTLLILLAGIFMGWLFFHKTEDKKNTESTEAPVFKKQIWTCSMDPQVKSDHPGLCPICGMDLVPLESLHPENQDSLSLHLSKEAAALANVETWTVKYLKPEKELSLYGTVVPDEQQVLSQVAHINGRVDKLWINFTGEHINKGQTIAQIYSSELVTAQQELIEAYRNRLQQPDVYKAVRDKLQQWRLTSLQIDKIEKEGVVQNSLEIVSDFAGIITSKKINTGDYITTGTVLFEVSDLSKIWVQFDVYEDDIPFVSINDKIFFTTQAIPGNHFSGNVSFIEPVLNSGSRVSRVRLEINNENGILKPGMFVSGSLKTVLPGNGSKLVIPSSAVLWTGKRSVVYIKLPGTEEPAFNLREIELGPVLGNYYVVNNGLNEGEEIVVNGAFSIDAASQLEGKPNMLNMKNN